MKKLMMFLYDLDTKIIARKDIKFRRLRPVRAYRRRLNSYIVFHYKKNYVGLPKNLNGTMLYCVREI